MDEQQFGPLTCIICGKKAFGFNYGVVSCNACKMFYRRANDDLLLENCRENKRCYEQENLPILGRHCKVCRYKKCMRANMQRLPIEPDVPEAQNDAKGFDKVQNELIPENASNSLNLQNAVDVWNALLAGNCQNVFDEKLKILAGIPKPFVSRDLVDYILLQELTLLNATRIEVYSTINICEDPSFADLVCQGSNLGKYKRPLPIKWEETVRKLKPWGSLGTLVVVEMIKTMLFYKELTYQDKINLLKGVAFKSHHLSIAFDNYTAKKARVFAPTGEEMFNENLIKNEKWAEKIKDLQEEPVKPIIKLMFNVNEYMLLNMIMICDPNIQNISDSGKKTLCQWQRKYTNLLLQSCLQSDPLHGPTRLLNLLSVIEDFRKQMKRTRNMLKLLYSDLNCYIPSILRESCNVEELV